MARRNRSIWEGLLGEGSTEGPNVTISIPREWAEELMRSLMTSLEIEDLGDEPDGMDEPHAEPDEDDLRGPSDGDDEFGGFSSGGDDDVDGFSSGDDDDGPADDDSEDDEDDDGKDEAVEPYGKPRTKAAFGEARGRSPSAPRRR